MPSRMKSTLVLLYHSSCLHRAICIVCLCAYGIKVPLATEKCVKQNKGERMFKSVDLKLGRPGRRDRLGDGDIISLVQIRKTILATRPHRWSAKRSRVLLASPLVLILSPAYLAAPRTACFCRRLSVAQPSASPAAERQHEVIMAIIHNSITVAVS